MNQQTAQKEPKTLSELIGEIRCTPGQTSGFLRSHEESVALIAQHVAACVAAETARWKEIAAQKDEWGKYWHDLAQTRVVSWRNTEAEVSRLRAALTEATNIIEVGIDLMHASDSMRHVHDGKSNYLWGNLSNAGNRFRSVSVAVSPTPVHRFSSLLALSPAPAEVNPIKITGRTKEELDAGFAKFQEQLREEGVAPRADEGTPTFPDIGSDPLKLPNDEYGKRNTVEKAHEVLSGINAVAQPGVPDQTALVWRADLDRVLMDRLWRTHHLPIIRRQDAELADLRRDKERLDWLDKADAEHDAVFIEGDPDVGVFSAWQIWRSSRNNGRPVLVEHGGSLRAAIDAARSPLAGRKEEEKT